MQRASNRLFSFPEPCNWNQNPRCTTHHHYHTAICLRAEGVPNYDFSSQKCSPLHLNIAAWNSSKKKTKKTPLPERTATCTKNSRERIHMYGATHCYAQHNGICFKTTRIKTNLLEFPHNCSFQLDMFLTFTNKERVSWVEAPPPPFLCARPAMHSIQSGGKYVENNEFWPIIYWARKLTFKIWINFFKKYAHVCVRGEVTMQPCCELNTQLKGFEPDHNLRPLVCIQLKYTEKGMCDKCEHRKSEIHPR